MWRHQQASGPGVEGYPTHHHSKSQQPGSRAARPEGTSGRLPHSTESQTVPGPPSPLLGAADPSREPPAIPLGPHPRLPSFRISNSSPDPLAISRALGTWDPFPDSPEHPRSLWLSPGPLPGPLLTRSLVALQVDDAHALETRAALIAAAVDQGEVPVRVAVHAWARRGSGF